MASLICPKVKKLRSHIKGGLIYAEIHPSFEIQDRWFKFPVSLIALTKESGKERKTNM